MTDTAVQEAVAAVAGGALLKGDKALYDEMASYMQSLASAEDGDAPPKTTITHNNQPVPVYSTQTGDVSFVLRTRLKHVLPKRLTSGPNAGHLAFRLGEPAPEHKAQMVIKRLFPDTPPVWVKERGNTLCPLHADHADRAFYDEIGLAGIRCEKATLTDDTQAERHFRKVHKGEWAIVNEHRGRLELKESRDAIKAQLEAMQALAASLQPQAAKVEVTTPQGQVAEFTPAEAPRTGEPSRVFCFECDPPVAFAHGGALSGHQRARHPKDN